MGGFGVFFENWLELAKQTEKLLDDLVLSSGTPGVNVVYISVYIYIYP